ncbi:MAG: rod shape-determining protein MreB [Candidatus Methanomethylicota archaeon]|uniref:Rod shape-determining protein MreB n=1 Tax=Thermoproteota archaeon TaxID=2056631 RepID=A0A497ELZ5_9CREN|nr:MAG: rod shape-determining protein MreB [Candidatus Verstraetearchaeota archaeon]
MIPIGLDIGTNYTKATANGKNVVFFPSLVAYGEEKDWTLKGESKSMYLGEEALSIMQTMENVEVLRPIHEGRVMHKSYIELAKYAMKLLGVGENLLIATGLPVKSSKKERFEVKSKLEDELKARVFLFPEPVGSLAYMKLDTGVCVDIGFGTTDIVVISHMEYLRGDTILMGVDKLYEGLEVAIRNKIGISITPEEMTKLLLNENYEIGRIRSGKRIAVSHKEIMDEYSNLMKSWAERIANRVKLILEGLSTSLVEDLILTGGGCLLPGVFEYFSENFEDIGNLKKPDDPLRSNAIGYYMLASAIAKEEEKSVEKMEKPPSLPEREEKKGEKKKKTSTK